MNYYELTLILNPDLIKEMGLKSRIYAEKNFSKEKHLQSFVKLSSGFALSYTFKIIHIYCITIYSISFWARRSNISLTLPNWSRSWLLFDRKLFHKRKFLH